LAPWAVAAAVGLALPASAGERLAAPAVDAPQSQTWRSGVERSELPAVLLPDGSGLPLDVWRGLGLAALEELLAQLELPPRSPALHRLWRRLLLSSAAPPEGASTEHFLALRLEALYRSGLLGDMGETIAQAMSAEGLHRPLVDALAARRAIGLGERAEGCRLIAKLAAPGADLPGRLKGETQLLAGYCAAAAGDLPGAGLAAGLAREEGLAAALPLSVLDGIAAGSRPQLALPTRVLLLDYRFLELLGPVNNGQLVERAEPALLVVLAQDARLEASVRLAAAEAAVAHNALEPQAVAAMWHSIAAAAPTAEEGEGKVRRALLWRGIELAASGEQQISLARALLASARGPEERRAIARLLRPLLERLTPQPEMVAAAPVALEIALASGDFGQARGWAESGGGSLGSFWLALIDSTDPQRRGGRVPSLAVLEDAALHARIGGEVLTRLVGVLDALDIDVPLRLWDTASRLPQPAGGYLPETGVLADLAQAAARQQVGRVVLLSLRALGPDGPERANVLALADALRALRRVGLEEDARALALEALLPMWRRTAGD
jgi:hypothetical protein